jgi:tetratricopeptide (TPR) repeat protein
MLEAAISALREGDAAKAEQLAAALLTSQGTNLRAALVLGQALLMQDRAQEAIDPLESALRHDDDPGARLLLARAFALLGREVEGLDHLRRATSRRPPFPPAFLELARLLGRLGRLEEGVAVIEAGLELTPEDAALSIGLGYLHLERDDRAKARVAFLRARSAAPERGDAMVALASVLALDGDHAAAADLYRQALIARPDDQVTRINLAKCLLELGERGAGEDALRAAARSEPRLVGSVIAALARAPHGRFFLRPSAAADFFA